MNKLPTTVVARTCLLTTLTLAFSAHGAEPGLYVGGGLGQSAYSGDIARQIGARYDGYEFLTLDSARVADDSATAFKLFAGYRFGSWLGIELAWHDLGEARSVYAVSPVTPVSPPPPGMTLEGRYQVRGAALSIFGEWAFNDVVSAIVRAGIIRASLDYHEVSIVGEEYRFDAPTDNDIRPAIGVGVNWRMTPQWDLRLDYDRFSGIGQRFDFTEHGNGRFDHLDVFTVNLSYRFGR